MNGSLDGFRPAVRTWFQQRFPEGPTDAQARGWPAIAAGEDTLIAAPTGSGKTLAAFLVCIDRLYRDLTSPAANPAGPSGPAVVYVSPLRALAVDIEENLRLPLAEIAELSREMGMDVPDLQVAVRTGDTPASARAAMMRRPPHILVTTPESLYLLVTSASGRAMLSGVQTVIVDEIHAVARDKRGAHLALTMERLESLCESRPTRIGLSATQRPIERIAELLVGTGPSRSGSDSASTSRCTIVDEGHLRTLDLALIVPGDELGAVASGEQMGEVFDRIAALIGEHRTTLIFVNTRRMAERVAHQLAERLGEGEVAAHHGSLSKDRRLRVEARLRAGELRALVATASLELGIDIGPVELVCQIGSPRAIATFLQRVGRSGHTRHAVPKGRIFPLTRDELVECAALLRAVKAGRLDVVQLPNAPLDILAQQIVAECAARDWNEDELFALVRRAAPFAELERAAFDEIVELLASGITTGRGRRAAHLHSDGINGVLRGRRGARITALTSGGAIPDRADYRVVLDPDETFIGTVDEDWAIESMAGDIFLLGSHSWQIRRVEQGIVRVTDAHGAPPTIPFWLGEAPGRTKELSDEVSALRSEANQFFGDGDGDGDGDGLHAWLMVECGLDEAAAAQIVVYFETAHVALGVLPTHDELIFERFFDDTGGMQLVVHSPLGGRLNRGFGLALRKRFCKTFDFELQAAASDDAIVLSLGPQHSFALEEATRYLFPETVGDVLAQAVLTSPMFTARWRWNLNRALVIPRMRGGRRNPPPIQRMEADDCMAAVFPTLAACQENVAGPIEIPDHPLVRQTMDDCLHEAMDVDGLRELVGAMQTGAVRVRCIDTTEPSVLAHEILNSRPYTFLDDAPLEERRTRAVVIPRGLPVEARELGRLDPSAIATVREQAWPNPRDAEELHDMLSVLGVFRVVAAWQPWFDELANAGRAMAVLSTVADESVELWCSAERHAEVAEVFDDTTHDRVVESHDRVIESIVRGHLEIAGPVTLDGLAEQTTLPVDAVSVALAVLEVEGFALRGQFDPAIQGEQFCARYLLERIHRLSRERMRREVEPVSAQDFLRFLLRWQHVVPGSQLDGRRGVLAVVEQLQGFELAAGAWEESIFPARVEGYRGDWLDEHCLSGEVTWGRLAVRTEPSVDDRVGSAPPGPSPERGRAVPSRATPVGFQLRSDLEWLLAAHRGGMIPSDPGPGPALEVFDCLGAHGALFHSDLVASTGRLPVEVEEALWHLVSRGLVTADGFQAVRSLLHSRERWASRQRRRQTRHGLRRGVLGTARAEGRWARFPGIATALDPHDVAEALAEQLLARWGVVFRDLLEREALSVEWRELLWAFRRLEARGQIRGGRFVHGFTGEQFALPSAVDMLRQVRKVERGGEVVHLSAADPLNLVGIITPGPRIPAFRTNTVSYRDGAPMTSAAG